VISTIEACVLMFAMGLCFGSFFNVLIYRLPRDQSIIRPGSRCPACRHSIGPLENIPVLSFMFLGGKCRWCRAPISVSYPAVELLTGCAAVLLWIAYVAPGLSLTAPYWQNAVIVAQALTLLIMIPITIIDARHYIIPDILTVPGIAGAAALSFLPGGLTPLQCGIGIAVGGGSLWAVGIIGSWALKKKDSMGGGDVRLMALVGGLWGWHIVFAAIFAASLIGTIAGLTLIAGKKIGKDHKLPFGPFLALGTWVAVLALPMLLAGYQRLLDRIATP